MSSSKDKDNDSDGDNAVAGAFVDPQYARATKRKVKRVSKVDWQKKAADMVHKQHLRELSQRNSSSASATPASAGSAVGGAPFPVRRQTKRVRERCPDNWVYCVPGCVCGTEPSSGSEEEDEDENGGDSKSRDKKTAVVRFSWLHEASAHPLLKKCCSNLLLCGAQQ
jgi:hypothetical protein